MSDDRDGDDVRSVDLSPIDPLREPRFAEIAQAIVRDGMAARERHADAAARYGAVASVARWSRPILAAAAVIVALATPLLIRSVPDVSSASADVAAAPDRFGIPASFVALAQSRHDPTPAEVIAAFDVHWRGGQ